MTELDAPSRPEHVPVPSLSAQERSGDEEKTQSKAAQVVAQAEAMAMEAGGAGSASETDNDDGDGFKEKLLYTLLDKDQDVPDKVKKDNDELSVNDENFRYNLTIGDVEKWRVKTALGKVEEIWFPIEKSIRKVFVAMKIKRVSEIDNVKETFRMRFHIYFNWLMTKEEYLSHCRARQDAKDTNNLEILTSWEPKWYPHLEFQNAIEEHTREWEVYPEQGCFRVQTFKDFGRDKKDKIPPHLFDSLAARFIRAKLELEITFSEELELQAFPFDCQDLSCVIHERTTGGVRCIFLPELRKPGFASVDPRYSVIDEWDLETAIIEFGDADSGRSRAGSSYAMIVLRLKMKRRWKVFMWNIVFLMACICGLALTGFALDEEDLGDRLNLIITLILTAVAFSYVVFDSLPNVPYLTAMDIYILLCYTYLVALMIETAFLKYIGPKYDAYVFWISVVIFFVYHGCFFTWTAHIRRDEELKLFYSSDEVEAEVNLLRPALKFDYTKRLRAGNEGRLLSFIGMMSIPKAMSAEEKEKFKRNQEALEKMYSQRSDAYKLAADRLHQINEKRREDEAKEKETKEKTGKAQLLTTEEMPNPSFERSNTGVDA